LYQNIKDILKIKKIKAKFKYLEWQTCSKIIKWWKL